MAFEVGRHIIGFEVQKILAAVDWLEDENKSHSVPIGVFGYGEGVSLAKSLFFPRTSKSKEPGHLGGTFPRWM